MLASTQMILTHPALDHRSVLISRVFSSSESFKAFGVRVIPPFSPPSWAQGDSGLREMRSSDITSDPMPWTACKTILVPGSLARKLQGHPLLLDPPLGLCRECLRASPFPGALLEGRMTTAFQMASNKYLHFILFCFSSSSP